MDAAEKKRKLAELSERQAKEFEQSLPMPRELFEALFTFLDDRLGEAGCCDDTSLTEMFLAESRIPRPEKILAWLEGQGGYCDCEVLANVAERFE